MIKIEDLHVRFRAHEGDVHAVQGLSINVKTGEFHTLLAPGGCGKTTTLRCLAGLEKPTKGRNTVADILYTMHMHALFLGKRRFNWHFETGSQIFGRNAKQFTEH